MLLLLLCFVLRRLFLIYLWEHLFPFDDLHIYDFTFPYQHSRVFYLHANMRKYNTLLEFPFLFYLDGIIIYNRKGVPKNTQSLSVEIAVQTDILIYSKSNSSLILSKPLKVFCEKVKTQTNLTNLKICSKKRRRSKK